MSARCKRLHCPLCHTLLPLLPHLLGTFLAFLPFCHLLPFCHPALPLCHCHLVILTAILSVICHCVISLAYFVSRITAIVLLYPLPIGSIVTRMQVSCHCEWHATCIASFMPGELACNLHPRARGRDYPLPWGRTCPSTPGASPVSQMNCRYLNLIFKFSLFHLARWKGCDIMIVMEVSGLI